ncbi:IS66 family transposase [Xanthomonas campestris]|uniref:IS66 family transposase n=1 Tax=Xanthomonas campestris TaxID=339 RepID=UPI003CCF65C8
MRGRPPNERQRARQERSQPMADVLRELLDAALRHLSPKSDMAETIAYGTSAGRRSVASWVTGVWRSTTTPA